MVSAGLPNAVITGLVTGSILALGAIGVALIYRIAEVPNFAHGELFTIGAYIALLANTPGELLLMAPFVESGGLSTGGRAILGSLAAATTLGTIYLLGGRRALEGSWWPTIPSRQVGLAVSGALAGLIGLGVFLTIPSLTAGIILAAPVVAVVGLLQERYVYRYFRGRGSELATLLIAALGLSIFFRNSLVALFTGSTRSYNIPNTISVFGTDIHFASSWLYNIYAATTGLTITIIDTGPAGNPTILTTTYSWPVMVGVSVLAVGVAGGYLWRRRGQLSSARGSETFDPRLKAAGLGLGVVALGAIVLGGSGTLPNTAWYETQIRISPLKLTILVGTLIVITALHVLLQETKLGTAMRASSDNLSLAQVRGINTRQVMMVTWIIAGVLGAVGGIMLGLLFNRVVPSLGFYLLLPMFAAVILGGAGKVSGAILGSYIVGLSEEVGLYAIPGASPAYRVPLAFTVLVIVLLIKPEGITGER